MKAAAMSVWIFINLLFFGMCGYLYLIWSQYWLYIEKQRLSGKVSLIDRSSISVSSHNTYYNKYVESPMNGSALVKEKKNRRSAISILWSGKDSSNSSSNVRLSNTIIRKNGSPRFPNIHKPILEFDSEKYVCNDYTIPECETQTKEFKEMLIKEFHRVLMSDSKVFTSGLESHNTYNVKYEGDNRREKSKEEVLCALKAVDVETVTKKDEPFGSFGFQIPLSPLQEGRKYNKCAVVTSAGALLGSRLGSFIDAHDIVIRFNNAPTENYTDDVGSKTTFRILNSQVSSKPEYKFLEDPMYKGISILIWDPANYSSTLTEWYNHPDFPLFPVYKRLLEERRNADVHILKPKVLWELWAVLQDSSPYRLRRNPPSSGFIGIWFALHRCDRVRVFEYVPSTRATRQCHYHVVREDIACTLGTWHPLAQEKALAERLRVNSDLEVFQTGFIDIPGLRNVDCS